MNKSLSLIGKKIGMLTVIDVDRSSSTKYLKMICKCECGTTKSMYSSYLLSGRAKSCGCQQNKGKKGINKKHGMTGTRIYREWASMRRRCRKNSPDSKNYYERGIKVCNEWDNDFISFYEWAVKNGYSDSLSLDRINNNKGYSPDNCRWVTIEEQQSNKANTVYVLYDGETYCLRTLCLKIGFPYKTAHHRYMRLLKKGKPITQEVLFAPIQKDKISFRFRK